MQNQSVLAVMVGNAVTEFGYFNGGDLRASWQVSTPEHLTADEARLQLAASFERFCFGEAERSLEAEGLTVVLGSVVPGLTDAWRDALAAETGHRVLVVGPRLKTGMTIACKNPAEVGADRVADAMAARQLANGPAIVVHLEAATAITVVDADGALAGGVIAPGFASSVSSLAHAAARLPEVEAYVPRQVVGKTTQEAIASGVFWGEVARIDGLVALVREELAEASSKEAAAASLRGQAKGAAGKPASGKPEGIGIDIPVILTGKNAHLLADHLQCRPQVVPQLTLQGLELCAQAAAARR